MDQWLALNTEKNLFEFVFDYQNFSFEPTIGGQKIERLAEFYKGKFYITILGFEWEKEHSAYENEYEKYNLSLRVFGTSQQSTHINLLYGQKNITSNDLGKIESQFYGVDGDIYLFSFLGVSGSFEKLLEANESGLVLNGEQSSYGAFIEISFLRFYMTQRKQKYFYTGSSTSNVEKDGTTFGVSLYL